MNCFECGTPKKPGGKFCGYCGVSFAEAQELGSGVSPDVSPDVNSNVSSSVNPDVSSNVSSFASSNVSTDVSSAAKNSNRTYHVRAKPVATSDRKQSKCKKKKDSNTLIIVLATIIIVIGIASIVFLIQRSGGVLESGADEMKERGIYYVM